MNIEKIYLFLDVIIRKARGLVFSFFFDMKLNSVGVNLKLKGCSFIKQKGFLFVGDNCWIEAVASYREKEYTPNLQFGKHVMLSNSVHISCISSIVIDDYSLIGSNVYIGDHSHGSLSIGDLDISVPPYQRLLDDASPVYIGKNTWIGDGVVILAGSYICDGCVVGANAVVKGEFRVPCVIAGVPGKSVKLLK